VYLDFSHASMVVAQERADIRQLQNIKWVNDKIENIPLLDLGNILNKIFFKIA
jgi:ubiquinone/menaquinone biosynthesis C-methylase UbiE